MDHLLHFSNKLGQKLAYHFSQGRGPLVVFLPGFMSDMEGSKAVALEGFCRRNGQAFLRFDYSGHGLSEGAFEEGTIGHWADDAFDLIQHVGEAMPLLLVGSSMGGWIAFLLSQRFGERVKALIGIAAAPDFTEKLMFNHFTRSQHQDMETKGFTFLPSDYEDPYPITKGLIEDGRNNQVLDAPIVFEGPVRLLQGDKDTAVPFEWPFRIKDQLTAEDVTVTIIKEGDHSLSRDMDLERLFKVLSELLADPRVMSSVD